MAFAARAWGIAVFFVVLSVAGRIMAVRSQTPPQRDVDPSVVPMSIGQWQGQDCPVSEKLLQQREAVVERTYKGPEGLDAHVVIVYGRNWRGIHPPPMCLTAIGWRMRREFTVQLPLEDGGSSRIRAMVMDRGDEVLGAVYLYADRDAISDSWTTLVGRMMDAPQAVRCLLGVYVVSRGRNKGGEDLVETATELCAALLPYVQSSIEPSEVRASRAG